ncbi:MAG: DOMON-like domain-containing protein [Pseudomonadota bacterium]
MFLSLIPHPDFPSVAVDQLAVEVEWEEGCFTFTYRVTGRADEVAWPETKRLDGESMRADELWRHTCFEAFFGEIGQPSYVELNFSPSLQWAAYAFDDYRAGMRNFDGDLGEVLVSSFHRPLDGEWRFGTFPLADPAHELRLGLSAVIEAKDGTKSYWALAHAPGPPDFHNPDCFIATLPAPAAK